jgi:hypothetical protein
MLLASEGDVTATVKIYGQAKNYKFSIAWRIAV